ncbi:MAG TPA: hypothetical protein VF821_13540, partial [Lentzea sp.]
PCTVRAPAHPRCAATHHPRMGMFSTVLDDYPPDRAPHPSSPQADSRQKHPARTAPGVLSLRAMGKSTTVMVRDLTCPRCHHTADHDVLISWGGDGIAHAEIGDWLHVGTWEAGTAGQPHVVIPGTGAPCPGCGAAGRFEVSLVNDIVDAVAWTPDQGSRSVAARNDPSM